MPYLFCSVTFSRISVRDGRSSVSVVHAAGAKVKDLENEADKLLEKLKPIQELQDNLKKNISQIKELINQARKQANSVSAARKTQWSPEDSAFQTLCYERTYLFNLQIYVLEMFANYCIFKCIFKYYISENLQSSCVLWLITY